MKGVKEMAKVTGGKIVEESGKHFRIRKVRVYASKAMREEVCFYPTWGWLTSRELFDLRQECHRIAP